MWCACVGNGECFIWASIGGQCVSHSKYDQRLRKSREVLQLACWKREETIGDRLERLKYKNWTHAWTAPACMYKWWDKTQVSISNKTKYKIFLSHQANRLASRIDHSFIRVALLNGLNERHKKKEVRRIFISTNWTESYLWIFDNEIYHETVVQTTLKRCANSNSIEILAVEWNFQKEEKREEKDFKTWWFSKSNVCCCCCWWRCGVK